MTDLMDILSGIHPMFAAIGGAIASLYIIRTLSNVSTTEVYFLAIATLLIYAFWKDMGNNNE